MSASQTGEFYIERNEEMILFWIINDALQFFVLPKKYLEITFVRRAWKINSKTHPEKNGSNVGSSITQP